MVTGRGTRNVISEEDLLYWANKDTRLPEEKLKQALDALDQKTGLVRRERRNETSVYEIVSEFLVPWIRRQKEERAQSAKLRKDVLKVLIGAGLVLLVIGGALLWRTIVLNRDQLVREANAKKDEAQEQVKYLETVADEYQEKARRAEIDRFASIRELENVAKERGASAELLASAQKESSALKSQFDGEISGLRVQLTEAETQMQDLRILNRQLEETAEKLNTDLSACRTSQNNGATTTGPRPGLDSPATGTGAAERTFALSGRVKFKETKAPVSKVVLDFSSDGRKVRAVSGDDGSYSAVGLLPGSYEVELTYLGATFGEKTEVIGNATNVNFKISLNGVGDSPLNLRVAENIEADLTPILKRYSSEKDLYVAQIPSERLRKAMNSARVPSSEHIFAMVNVFTFSPTKRQGLLFGQRGLYYFTAFFTSKGPQQGFIPYVDLVSREFARKGNEVSLGHGQFFNVTASSFSTRDLTALLEDVKGLISRKLSLSLG
jgi:hypothetical protein